MPYVVNILDEAQHDIIEDTLYVKENFGEEAAEESYLSVMGKFDLLEAQPELGAKVPELVALGITNYRVLTHQKHTKILYELDEANQAITIHMVYGSNQDFQRMLYRRIIRHM